MLHTMIVSEAELNDFDDRRVMESTIPEMVCQLVRASIPTTNLIDCRIPYNDSIGQPGWDGYVETVSGFLSFVPTGKSFWEIGTGSEPRKKATGDFKKRTRQMTPESRAESIYVFVTPRSAGKGGWNEPSQRRWRERLKGFGWKDIRIIDGHRLAEWTREFPGIG